MNIRDVIKQLQEIEAEHGDILVTACVGDGKGILCRETVESMNFCCGPEGEYPMACLYTFKE